MNESEIVILFIETASKRSEVRLNKSQLISTLKHSLLPLTGLINQKLKSTLLNIYLDDSRMLGYYSLPNYSTLKVEGQFSNGISDYNDCSKTLKFEISESEYDLKRESVRQFKKLNKLGRFSTTTTSKSTIESNNDSNNNNGDGINCVKVGDRFRHRGRGDRGTIAYIGSLPTKVGTFYGVQYDEPVGKNNGSFLGVEYFCCLSGYGGFTRLDLIEVGDFPPADILDDLLDEF